MADIVQKIPPTPPGTYQRVTNIRRSSFGHVLVPISTGGATPLPSSYELKGDWCEIETDLPVQIEIDETVIEPYQYERLRTDYPLYGPQPAILWRPVRFRYNKPFERIRFVVDPNTAYLNTLDYTGNDLWGLIHVYYGTADVELQRTERSLPFTVRAADAVDGFGISRHTDVQLLLHDGASQFGGVYYTPAEVEITGFTFWNDNDNPIEYFRIGYRGSVVAPYRWLLEHWPEQGGVPAGVTVQTRGTVHLPCPLRVPVAGINWQTGPPPPGALGLIVEVRGGVAGTNNEWVLNCRAVG